MVFCKINLGIRALYQSIRKRKRYPKDIKVKGYSAENMRIDLKSKIFINLYAEQNVK